MKKNLTPGLLNCDTTNILDRGILCWEAGAVLSCAFWDVEQHPWSPPPLTRSWQPKLSWDLTMCPLETESPQVHNHWFQPAYWSSCLLWILVFCPAVGKGRLVNRNLSVPSEVGLFHHTVVVDPHETCPRCLYVSSASSAGAWEELFTQPVETFTSGL